MDQIELFSVFTSRLEKIGIPYMATGSVASMLYGIPRFTHDIDLVVELPAHQIPLLMDGFPLADFYCPPSEVLIVESRRPLRGHFNIIHHDSGLKADIYLYKTDALQAWGLENKKRIALSPSIGIWAAPPEYVILRKLEYYREGHSEKHLNDINGMLEISRKQIDFKIIQSWIEKLNLQPQWDRIRTS